MSIRKRGWVNGDGSRTEIWTATYTDQAVNAAPRALPASATPKPSTPPSRRSPPRRPHPRQPIRHGRRGRPHLARCLRELRPRAEHNAVYRQHVDLHIIPFLGG